MDYLKRAEAYALDQGDENWFKHFYVRYRETMGVKDSVWYALEWLYGKTTAENLYRG